ncbi:MAG: class D sortase [Gemmatimonadaceae bacterium]
MRLRRAAGVALAAAGAILLIGAGATYARGALRQDALRAEWDAGEAHRAVGELAASLDREVASTPSIGAPVGRLIISRIALDEIIVEGVGDAELNAGPGHLPGSVLPGAVGNAVVSAHRDRHFHGLDAIAVGDTVVTESHRRRVTWVIIERRIVERGAPALFATTDARLTLTTCWPVRYTGPAPDRLILGARKVLERGT